MFSCRQTNMFTFSVTRQNALWVSYKPNKHDECEQNTAKYNMLAAYKQNPLTKSFLHSRAAYWQESGDTYHNPGATIQYNVILHAR